MMPSSMRCAKPRQDLGLREVNTNRRVAWNLMMKIRTRTKMVKMMAIWVRMEKKMTMMPVIITSEPMVNDFSFVNWVRK